MNSLKENKHEEITQVLSTMFLGEKRTSQMVTEIKRRFKEIVKGAPSNQILIHRNIQEKIEGIHH